MKTYKATIKGISPLLMHRYPLQPVEGFEKLPAQEQAEHSAYRRADGFLFVPGVNLQRALVSAATFSKGKGRASLQKIAAACIIVNEAECSLNQKDYSVDSRPVVIAATGGRIVRSRPRLEQWEISFSVTFDELLITDVQVHRIIQDCGQRVGILDFRPERKGPFGRFIITAWEEAKE